MEFRNPYWSETTKISMLQRRIIVHSIIYYELDGSLVSDKMFDENARQLVKLQEQFPEDAERSQYWYVFYDFDANTGFHLYDRLNKHDKSYLSHIARYVLKLSKGGQNGKEAKSNKRNNRA